ncbi:MAG: DNA-binding transcriptional regulator [Alphaproteobacteria bacterium]|nr:MAG: DNA-binding transcriptional regulator [Alphaproteobacteria bacterium]
MKKNLTNHAAPVEDLCAVLLALEDPQQAASFLSDLCTPTEVAALADRWHAARLLSQGFSQRDVASRTGVALGTVTRVAKALKSGRGGYAAMLQKLKDMRAAAA